jgi:hypothetical protein
MQYLVTGEWVEDPIVSEEFPALWEQMVHPSISLRSLYICKKRLPLSIIL